MRGSVCGYVVVRPTGEPIPGAAIVASEFATIIEGTDASQERQRMPPGHLAAALTDDLGRFTFDLREGVWHLRAQGPEGEPLGEASVAVFPNALSDVTIEVEKMPYVVPPPTRRPASRTVLRGSVRGRVVRADTGQPVVAAITVVRGPGPSPDPAPLTDEDGWFTMSGLESGPWLLRALGPGGESGEAAVRVLDDALSDMTIEVEEAPQETPRPQRRGRTNKTGRRMTGSIHGRVERRGSRPVRDAAITIVRGAGSAPDIAPLTNEEGRFMLDGLPPGEWVLRAVAPGGEAGEGTVRVSADAVADLTITVV